MGSSYQLVGDAYTDIDSGRIACGYTEEEPDSVGKTEKSVEFL